MSVEESRLIREEKKEEYFDGHESKKGIVDLTDFQKRRARLCTPIGLDGNPGRTMWPI